MSPNIAEAALAFLSRVTLNAEETNAFIAVRTALEEAATVQAQPELRVVEQPREPELAEK